MAHPRESVEDGVGDEAAPRRIDVRVTVATLLPHEKAQRVDDVQLIAREFFTPERIGVAVLGNLDGFALTPDQLAC